MSNKEHAKDIYELLKQAADLPRRARGDPDKFLQLADAMWAIFANKRGKMLNEVRFKARIVESVLNPEFYKDVPNPDLFATMACLANVHFFLECANTFYNQSLEPDASTDQLLYAARQVAKCLFQDLKNQCNQPLPQCREHEQTTN